MPRRHVFAGTLLSLIVAGSSAQDGIARGPGLQRPDRARGGLMQLIWAAPVSGSWFDAANWLPMMVPGLGGDSTATLGGTGAYTVDVDDPNNPAGPNGITISNPDAILRIHHAPTPTGFPTSLEVFGTIANDGVIRVGGIGGTGSAGLALPGSSLTGSGQLILDDSLADAVIGEIGGLFGGVITNGPTHTIRGSGRIFESDVFNMGTIEAGVPAGAILFSDSGDELVNEGLIVARNGGSMVLTGMQVTNQVGGTILAEAGGEIVYRDGPWANEPGAVTRLDGGVLRITQGPSPATAMFLSGAGTVESTNGGEVLVEPGARLILESGTPGDGPTLDAMVRAKGGAEIQLGIALSSILPLARNHGTISLSPAGTASDTLLLALDDATIEGSGDILLLSDVGDAVVRAEPGFTLTHGVDHTIHGRGRVEGMIVNHGEIVADDPLGPLTLSIGGQLNSDNSGSLRATGGGVLVIDNSYFTSTGDVVAETGSRVEFINNAGTQGGKLIIDGGEALTPTGEGSGFEEADILTLNGGVFRVENGAVCGIESGSLAGELAIDGGGFLDLAEYDAQGYLNHGVITMNAEGSGTRTVIKLGSGGFDGDGRVVMRAPSEIDRSSSSGFFLNGPLHTIEGSGEIFAQFDNRGLIEANRPGETLTLWDRMSSSGVVRSVGGATLVLEVGEIDQSGGGRVVADGAEVVCPAVAFYMGSIEASGTGRFRAPAGAFFWFQGGVTSHAPIALDAGADLSVFAPGMTNNGVIDVNHDAGSADSALRIGETATIDGDGAVVLGLHASGGPGTARIIAAPGAVATFGAGQEIRGEGEVTGDVVLRGTTRPLDADASGEAGLIDFMNGAVTLDSEHSFVIAGHGDGFSAVSFGSPLALAGSLVVDGSDLDASFGFGSASIVIASPMLSGAFDGIVIIDPPGPRRLRVDVGSSEVTVVVACPADLAEPLNELDFNDVVAFLDAFGAGDPDADFAPPFGVFNFNDVIAYLIAYADGCDLL